MKLTKLTKNPDYVRYNIDTVVKVNDLITVKASSFGSLITEQTTFGKIQFLEDNDNDLTFFLNNKECKYDGFKKIYSALFTDSFDDFQTSVHKFIDTKVAKSFKYHAIHLDHEDIIDLLEETVDDLPKYMDTKGDTYVSRHWLANNLLKVLDESHVPSFSFTKENGKKSYGALLIAYENKIAKLKRNVQSN